MILEKLFDLAATASFARFARGNETALRSKHVVEMREVALAECPEALHVVVEPTAEGFIE